MSIATLPDHGVKTHEPRFNPYDDNGGSIVAVGGDDFVIIASDTRLSTGYSIYTRHQSKIFKLSKISALACAGCWSDVLTFTRLINARMQMYLHEHNKEMSTPALAQMLSTMMYHKRFFPYYVSNILGGLEKDGSGWIYSYDPIGNMERSKFRAGGSSGALLQPLLDNQLGFANMENVESRSISLEKALAVVRDVFISAAERDIYTGDKIHVTVITKDEIKEDTLQLTKD
uniref:Proteasome subunit beta n=1 Tax=Maconellicoccus hirsutus TaxID=177089 RepID=A2I426_MACHI|nr:putative proteasome subunit, beta type, 1 [Maconellicoccus hirsutus]